MFAEFSADPGAPLARPVWRTRDLLWGLLLLLGALALVTLGLAALALSGAVDRDSGPVSGAATIAFELLLGGAVLWLARQRRLGPAELGFVRPRRWWPALVAWGGAYTILIAYALLLAALQALGVDVSRLSEGNPLPVDPRQSARLLVLFGFAVLLVAPLCEELFFRALLFRGLRGYWRLWPSLLGSATAFAVFHLNPGVILPFAGIGVLFAWANEQSGSLWSSIGAHAAFNGVSLLLSVIGTDA